jgi:hypothetical protein
MPVKGMLVSSLAQGSDDQLREKIAQLIEKLSWAISEESEEAMNELSSDEY